MKDNLVLIVLYLGMFQGLFLALALLLIRNKRKDTIYLLISLIVCFCSLILIQILKYYLPEPAIISMLKLGSGIPLLIGPLLYFYLVSVVDQQFKIGWKESLHLAPFLFFTLFAFWFGSLAGSVIFLALKSFHTFGYYLWCMRRLSAKASPRKVWYNRKLLLRLFYVQLAAFLLIHLIVILEMALPATQIESDLISSLIFVFFFFAFVLTIIVFPTGTLPDKSPLKYRKSILKESDKDPIKQQLIQLIRNEKLYLDPDISLSDIAGKMEISTNHLSQVINEMFHKNFSQFINAYRIEEVKNLMVDDKKTILAAAYESGFNSKSAFNRIFKEMEGITPSGYRKMLKK